MQFLDLTLPTAAENIACDEALLEMRDRDGGGEILRCWEADAPFVVLGCGNRAADEAHVEWCRANGVPIVRRTSGGGAVLQGPGCLNFSLILKVPSEGPLTAISSTNASLTRRHAEALRPLLGPEVAAQGHTDIALGLRKFSGNAQRRKRDWLLFHGTFLLDFDIPLIGRTLAMPTREPDYRHHRAHEEFVINTGAAAERIKSALRALWQADGALADVPVAEIARLTRERFATDAWNLKM